jgi:O-antigen ligase
MMCYSYLLNEKLTGYRIGDGILAILFLFQGLITFSRGGMVSAVLALIAFMIVSGFIKLFFGKDRSYAVGSFLILVGVVMSVFYVNKLTDGNLFLRYSGETSGTLAGHRDRNLTTLTTGRDEIALEDLELWKQAPFFGLGAGSSKHLREVRTGVASHLEPTRLLAEHGFIGILILILIFYNIYLVSKQTDRLTKAFKLALLVLAFSTMFHSSMRTYIIPVSLAICMIHVPLISRRDYLPGT